MPNITQPFANNQTCDIYRYGNGPPSAPDVANVQIMLVASYFKHTEQGEGDDMITRYTHTTLMPYGTDCRDGYSYGTQGNCDTLRIPANSGFAGSIYVVRFVETKARGTPFEHLKVYLDRETPNWPSANT